MLPLAARNLTPQLLGDVGRRFDRRDALEQLLLTLGRARSSKRPASDSASTIRSRSVTYADACAKRSFNGSISSCA